MCVCKIDFIQISWTFSVIDSKYLSFQFDFRALKIYIYYWAIFVIPLKGKSSEVKTQNFKKVRFLHYCYKNSKIFFLQQLLSIVKIPIPLRHSPLIFKFTTDRHPCWSHTSRKTICLDRSKRMDAKEGRECFH